MDLATITGESIWNVFTTPLAVFGCLLIVLLVIKAPKRIIEWIKDKIGW